MVCWAQRGGEGKIKSTAGHPAGEQRPTEAGTLCCCFLCTSPAGVDKGISWEVVVVVMVVLSCV